MPKKKQKKVKMPELTVRKDPKGGKVKVHDISFTTPVDKASP